MASKQTLRQVVAKSLPIGYNIVDVEGQTDDKVLFECGERTYLVQMGMFPDIVEFLEVVEVQHVDFSLWHALQCNYLNCSLEGFKFRARPAQEDKDPIILLECGLSLLVTDLSSLGGMLPTVLSRLDKGCEVFNAFIGTLEDAYDEALDDEDMSRFDDDMLVHDVAYWNSRLPFADGEDEDDEGEYEEDDEDDEDDDDEGDDDDTRN